MKEKAARTYLLGKPEAWEDYPFGRDVAVFKIRTKMFALMTSRDGLVRINLKCDPGQAFILRDMFTAVVPGYHMNKTHWNTVLLDGSIPEGEIQRMIDHSFGLVVKGLLKRERVALEIAHGPEHLYCD